MILTRSHRIGRLTLVLGVAAALSATGCHDASGRPRAHTPEVTRPDQVTDLNTLYSQNCSACHGHDGHDGVAIALNNPIYLAVAGAENVRRITAQGVPNTTMPPFAESQGGSLTDQQVSALVQNMVQKWGRPNSLTGQSAPPYAASGQGNPAAGQQAFGTYCASCHGADANGTKLNDGSFTGSLIDSSYLALITDQGLRSIILAGVINGKPHDWRSYTSHPMTDADITNIVAWLASHRVPNPGQPYATRQ